MSKSKSDKTDTAKPFHNNRRMSLIVVVILVMLIGLYDVTIGNNTRFYAKWIECGSKPFEAKGSGYLNAGAKYYYEPSSFPGIHASIDYFCTPLEAEKAGYSATPDSYNFPNLKKTNQ